MFHFDGNTIAQVHSVHPKFIARSSAKLLTTRRRLPSCLYIFRPMIVSPNASSGCYGRCSVLSLSPTNVQSCGPRFLRLSKPPHAVNNQHSHVEEELMRMQSQLRADAQADGATIAEPQRGRKHVFRDTEAHPYQRQPHHHVYHEQNGTTHFLEEAAGDLDLKEAVELSYQYSNNIVHYRTDVGEDLEPLQQHPTFASGMVVTPIPKPLVHRARVDDYTHPSLLSRDLVAALLRGAKLTLELPDEPATVSTLLTALGRAATKLRTFGLATALDPVYEPGSTANGCSTTRYHSVNPPSPSSSHDTVHTNTPGSCTLILCARAVPIPPAASSPSAIPDTYAVGRPMGQQVLRVGPSAPGVHALLPALLRAILRDGLVTLRCCWFDEDTDSDSWSDEEVDDVACGGEGNGGSSSLDTHGGGGGGGTSVAQQQTQISDVMSAHTKATGAPGSLVRVPCVLRAIFKLDRQLRGLDLGGLVLLPHSFARGGPHSSTQVLHLDVVIA